ncbi:hypothetical protein HK102_010433, partial [Quaeritorhiza haematococci]
KNPIRDSLDLISKHDTQRMWCEKAEDGAVIKLSWYRGRWRMATTRKLNAKKSFWQSDRSFDALVNSLVTRGFYRRLKKTHTYSVILKHPETSNMVVHSEPSLVIVSARDLCTGREEIPELAKLVPDPRVLNLRTPHVLTAPDHGTHRGLITITRSTGLSYERFKYDYHWFREAAQ